MRVPTMIEFDKNFNEHLKKYVCNSKLKIFSTHINNMKPYSHCCFTSEMENIARFLILDLYFISFIQSFVVDFEDMNF